ncbi:MAG: hypothetical protein ACTHMM_10160 [Agriterribacter sp.]
MLLFGILSSCRTVNKSSKSESKKQEVKTEASKEENNVKQDNSTVDEQRDIEKVGKVKVSLEYETGKDSGKTIIQTVYLPTGKAVNQSALDKIVNALVNDRLKKVNIEGDFNLTDKTKTTTQNNIKDSTVKKETAKSESKTEEKKKEKEKKVKGIPVGVSIWIVAVIAVLIVAFVLYRKFIK